MRAIRIVHTSDQNEPATVDSGVIPWPLFLFPEPRGGARLNCGDSVPTIREPATPELYMAQRASEKPLELRGSVQLRTYA